MQFHASQEMSASKVQSSPDRTTAQSLKKKQEVKFTAVGSSNSNHSKKFTKASTEVKRAQKAESSTSEFSRKSTVVTHTKEIKKIITTIKVQSVTDLSSADAGSEDGTHREKEKQRWEKKDVPKRELAITRPERKQKEEEGEEKVKKEEVKEEPRKLTIIRPERGPINFTRRFELLVTSFTMNVTNIVVSELDSGCLKDVKI